MRYTTYSRYLPELADTVNLQGLLDQLADFLLQSGFAGGPYSHPFWGGFGEDESRPPTDPLPHATPQPLIDSGQVAPAILPEPLAHPLHRSVALAPPQLPPAH